MPHEVYRYAAFRTSCGLIQVDGDGTETELFR